jgi:uncharacterized protein YjbI with pentapeptide repeats
MFGTAPRQPVERAGYRELLRSLGEFKRRALRWLRVWLNMRHNTLESAGDASGAEVFPWLEHWAIAGAVLGAAAAGAIAWNAHFGTSALICTVLLGAIAGGVAGICIALRRAVPPSARNDPAAEPSVDLWDAWVDGDPTGIVEGTDVGAVPIGPIREAFAQRALVRPRVFAPTSGDSLPLEDAIAPYLTTENPIAIEISGAAGSGKTTALRHLASIIPPYLRVALLDEPQPRNVADALTAGWVIYTSVARSTFIVSVVAPVVRFSLVRWGKDEFIEYLLSRDSRRCASVMSRLPQSDAGAGWLDGNPELSRIVLDRMLGDEEIVDVRHALRRELDELIPHGETRHAVQADCFEAVTSHTRQPTRADADHVAWNLEGRIRRRQLIRHRPVQLLLAADHLARAVRHGTSFDELAGRLPRDLVQESASQIATDWRSVGRLLDLISSSNRRIHATVASLIVALELGSRCERWEWFEAARASGDPAEFALLTRAMKASFWKPDQPVPRLAGAYLNHAKWPEIDLAGAHLQGADLSSANLRESRLDGAQLKNAQLLRSVLTAACLERAHLEGADLSEADLGKVRAPNATFRAARLVGAKLCAANLERAVFTGADLAGSRFMGANLTFADLQATQLEGADFTRADLSRATLRNVRLASATFTDASFMGADLFQCDLEGMELPDANFEGADLRGALLTGTRMPDANFHGADLRATGLAEIDWEGADLRNADLRGAAFHLGSSRSGLVASPIACEGSRTGFYTDDYSDQDFKNPEEIRKANLCGADLRGARIDGVDFYLVDLRGARLDADQIEHVRGSGAILEPSA